MTGGGWLGIKPIYIYVHIFIYMHIHARIYICVYMYIYVYNDDINIMKNSIDMQLEIYDYINVLYVSIVVINMIHKSY
jgi:hypothetical protein